MARKRNGFISDFNKLHWIWKLMLISGGFGVVNAVIRRAKGEPEYEAEPEYGGMESNPHSSMPPWLREQMSNPQPAVPYPSLSSAPLNDSGGWQGQWDRFTSR